MQGTHEAGPHIAIVEDDAEIARLVVRALDEHGFRATWFATGKSFLTENRETFDLCLLDLGLPDGDGLGILPQLRDNHPLPVIIVSARQDRADIISGLEIGADDYVIKPFDPREVVARIRSVLRRTTATSTPPSSRRTARFAGYVFDRDSNSVVLPDGSSKQLTHAEATLLGALLEANKRILSRDHLMAQLGKDDVFDRAVDVQISRLRKKLSQNSQANPIQTAYGAGYILAASVTWS